MAELSTPPIDCPNQRVVVLINGFPIPTLEVETIHNKDGVADRNVYSTAIIPTTWKNEDIVGNIDAFGDEGGYFDTAEVYWQDTESGTWVHNHTGYVRAVGGGNKPGTAKIIIGGWAQFFTAIPFSGTYDNPTVSTVLNDVVSAFFEHAPTALGLTGLGPAEEKSVSATDIAASTGAGQAGSLHSKFRVAVWEGFENLGIIDLGLQEIDDRSLPAHKNFSNNRHTLKDVMEWVCGETNAKWYIDIGGGEPVLVYDKNLQHKHFYDASIGSPGCRVIDNDAIQEIVPINAITVNGKSSTSIAGFHIKELPSSEYPMATAQYDPLVNAAGNQLLRPVVESETLTLEATEEKAKRTLREEISGASGGDITMFGKPDIEPFDHFTGTPTCNGHHISDLSPLEYEVTSVQHKKVGGGEYGTRIGCHVWVDPNKISVKSSMEKK